MDASISIGQIVLNEYHKVEQTVPVKVVNEMNPHDSKKNDLY